MQNPRVLLAPASNQVSHLGMGASMLKSALTPISGDAGALIWHGRDLRRYRRLLSPPLQRLLTCPGTAALGRGVAVMPASSSVSPASALAHLASDAVRAAAESPFLEGSLAHASAVLCCIALPTPPGRSSPRHCICSPPPPPPLPIPPPQSTPSSGPEHIKSITNQFMTHLTSSAGRAAAASPFLADASQELCCIALFTPPGVSLSSVSTWTWLAAKDVDAWEPHFCSYPHGLQCRAAAAESPFLEGSVADASPVLHGIALTTSPGMPLSWSLCMAACPIQQRTLAFCT